MAKKIEIEILAKGKPAERSIDKVGKKTKKLAKTTAKSGSKMSASWVKVGLAVAGVGMALSKATEAHSVQLKAEIALYNALRLNAKQGEHTLDMWKDYASALQGVTIYGDEMTLQQLAMLKTMGLSDKQTKEVIETAMDYATAFGKDVPSAVKELTMTLSGQLGTIKRTMPALREYTKEELKQGVVIRDVSKLMRGQAKALADTPWGESIQNANQYGDEMERIGDQLLGLASDSGLMAGISARLNDVSIAFRGFAQDMVGYKQAIFGAEKEDRIKWLEDSIKTLEDFASNDTKSSLQELGNWFDNTFGTPAVDKIAKLKEELATLKDPIDEVGKAFKGANEKQKELSEVGKKVTKGLEDAFVNMAMGIKTNFKDMARSIISYMIRIQYQKTIGKAILGLFHTGTAEVKHTGGAIGSTKIPSFHTGMRSDERLAKLQVGEAVINRGGASKNRNAIEAMNKGYSVGGSGGNITTAEINFNVQAIDASSFNSYLVNNKGTIESIINSSLASNGSVRRTIRQVI